MDFYHFCSASCNSFPLLCHCHKTREKINPIEGMKQNKQINFSCGSVIMFHYFIDLLFFLFFVAFSAVRGTAERNESSGGKFINKTRSEFKAQSAESGKSWLCSENILHVTVSCISSDYFHRYISCKRSYSTLWGAQQS